MGRCEGESGDYVAPCGGGDCDGGEEEVVDWGAGDLAGEAAADYGEGV